MEFHKELLNDPRDNQRDACGVGFIANMKGLRSHKVVTKGLEILRKMDHRAGRAADNKTSDGSGILLSIPHNILKEFALGIGKSLPKEGSYALGMIFLPKNEKDYSKCIAKINETAVLNGLDILFYRDVPVDSSVLGEIAKISEPKIVQAVIVDNAKNNAKPFKWRIFILKKMLETFGRSSFGMEQKDFYFASLSTESVCYKGLVLPKDLPEYFHDLKNKAYKSSFAMIHQRFSTNTNPSWPLAQPFRIICHNGEINTLRGNINAMYARSFIIENEELNDDIKNNMGIICSPGFSDSAMLDNAIEFLLQTGRTLPQAMSMVIPEPWEKNYEMDEKLRNYYEYQSYIMEPWDGPAFVGFVHDGCIGAILDRNGLRPGRYCVTKDNFVIMASESGVVDIKHEMVVEKGKISPGRIFILDMKKGVILDDNKIKNELAEKNPYGDWLNRNRINMSDIEKKEKYHDSEDLKSKKTELLNYFGYSKEDMRVIISSMANEGKEPVGSMGNDTPIAILSKNRPLLYNYFKQLFAQVTNPPIDAIREELVTSMSTFLGSEKNIFDESEEHCRMIRLNGPVLSDSQFSAIENFSDSYLKVKKITTTYKKEASSLEEAINDLITATFKAIDEDRANIIILSDRDIDSEKLAIPALLAMSSVHHALIKTGRRSRCSIVIESGEPRETHHFALLFGYGASAVYPYLPLHLIKEMDVSYGFSQDKNYKDMQYNFIKAINEGVLKIMSKMGISTLQSYRGAQIFEALGLNKEFVDKYFTWTPTRIGGIGVAEIEDDIKYRHKRAFSNKDYKFFELEDVGFYHWRRTGENHLHSPNMISSLQKSLVINSREEFKNFCKTVDDQSKEQLNLRGLLKFKKREPIPLDEVESVKSIVKRFATGAMSFGSISKEAHETIAVAMNRIGAKSNSGEGGEDAVRFNRDSSGDLKRSAIKQVASARFGVTSHYLINADELQIKMAQGAKPGEGGQLPGHKVDPEIARVRNSTPGITLISPPPHHDIYSIEDLAQLIFDLKNANREARISVKLVSEFGVGTIASGVAKAKADVILISGYEGGTGASPISSIKHAGLPWELGLSEAHRSLVENGLRQRVILQADGQLRTPRDIAIAALLGAEEWGIGTGALIALGCIMMRKCHLNTCPVGVATQDPELRKKFTGQPEHLINYIFLLAEGLREIMASLGFRKVEEMIGRVDVLEKNNEIQHKNIDKINLDFILASTNARSVGEEVKSQNHEIFDTIDYKQLLPIFSKFQLERKNVNKKIKINSESRSVGTMLSSEISKFYGSGGLPEDSISLNFFGSSGQSFMAFGAKGINARIIGDVNDYCGKGLSGATVSVVSPEYTNFKKNSVNVICGNTALYGATSGHLYVNGKAGERFAVRNSGAHAVVEGLGDHGCEYMTGGSVVVLGSIGRNFAAGMSGGFAYLYDPNRSFMKNINKEMVDVFEPDADEKDFILSQLKNHYRFTNSELASSMIKNWESESENFVVIMPLAYKKMFKK